jgi:hypothetical protein
MFAGNASMFFRLVLILPFGFVALSRAGSPSKGRLVFEHRKRYTESGRDQI